MQYEFDNVSNSFDKLPNSLDNISSNIKYSFNYTAISVINLNLGVQVYYSYDLDPYKRPDQKKQGRENKNKARKKPGWEKRNGYRRPKPPKHHTPGRDHRKYS